MELNFNRKKKIIKCKSNLYKIVLRKCGKISGKYDGVNSLSYLINNMTDSK